MDLGSIFRLDGRIAVVIGAGSGIGQACAAGLASQGAMVICADTNFEAASSTASRIGGEASIVDISNSASVKQLLDGISAKYSRLDVVVSTPGINVRKQLLDYQDEEFDRVISVNLKGTFNVLREAGRIMSGYGRGSIIACSSIRSLTVEPGQGVYAATKSGIVQLVRALAAELGTTGVRVNALAPGVVETPLTGPIKNQPDWYKAYADKNVLKRWAQAEEMAGPVMFLASDAASYVTGTVLFADGGWTAADGRFQPPL